MLLEWRAALDLTIPTHVMLWAAILPLTTKCRDALNLTIPTHVALGSPFCCWFSSWHARKC